MSMPDVGVKVLLRKKEISISLLWIISTTIEILLDINESKLKGEDEKEDN